MKTGGVATTPVVSSLSKWKAAHELLVEDGNFPVEHEPSALQSASAAAISLRKVRVLVAVAMYSRRNICICVS
jgi:hypothetical protein